MNDELLAAATSALRLASLWCRAMDDQLGPEEVRDAIAGLCALPERERELQVSYLISCTARMFSDHLRIDCDQEPARAAGALDELVTVTVARHHADRIDGEWSDLTQSLDALDLEAARRRVVARGAPFPGREGRQEPPPPLPAPRPHPYAPATTTPYLCVCGWAEDAPFHRVSSPDSPR